MLTKYGVTNCCHDLRKYLDKKNELKKYAESKKIKLNINGKASYTTVDNPVNFRSNLIRRWELIHLSSLAYQHHNG